MNPAELGLHAIASVARESGVIEAAPGCISAPVTGDAIGTVDADSVESMVALMSSAMAVTCFEEA